MIGTGKKEGWSERFQDLRNWCQLPQDELHTPNVNLNDEFNFSIEDGNANNWDSFSSQVDLPCDQWVNDTQFGISPCLTGFGEINNTLEEKIPLGVINKAPNLLGSGGKLLYTVTNDACRSPLKSKGNVLLSQGIEKTPTTEDCTFLNMAVPIEPETNDPIYILNDCYVLPEEMPEFSSAKLNSSSFSTSLFRTPTPLQSLIQTPPIQTKKITTIDRENTEPGVLSKQNNLENMQIKKGGQGVNNFIKVPAISIEQKGNQTTEILSTRGRNKPQLKLNIAAANNNNANKITSSLNTPDVIKNLTEGDNKEFNLLQYVCFDGDFPGLSQEDQVEEERGVEGKAIRDHDYTDSWNVIEDNKSDIIIKTEPGSPASTSCSLSNKSTTKRKRQHDENSDYVVSDTEDSSSEDSQQEWSPTPAKKRTKRKTSLNSNKNNNKNVGTGGKKLRRGRRSSNQVSNEAEASSSNNGQDQYRALRERNNEASRRSRMNRKQRDVEMLNQADELERKNIRLNATAEKMESLVKYLRAEILKNLTKPK